MPPPWKNLAAGLEERLDEDLLPAIYTTLSVSTETLRDELEQLGHPLDPESASMDDLDAAADDLRVRTGTSASVPCRFYNEL